MKLYVLLAFLVFCTIQNASADWRDEMRQKHINRLAIFIKGMEMILETTVRVKNTPGAMVCFNIAHEQHEELTARHRSEIELCTAPNVEKPEATVCCEKSRKAAFSDGATISNVANECIAKS